MPIHSKNKGARFEREVAKILNDAGFESRRGVQFSGGLDSPDVISTFPFHIEAKRVEKLNLTSAVHQSHKDAGTEDYCVIHKKNHEPILFTCPLALILKYIPKK